MRYCFKYLMIIYIFISTITTYSQVLSIPIPSLIEATKKMVLPIVCIDIFNNDTLSSQGSCVILGDNKKYLFLTCHHVIAIKDTNNRFIGYFTNIYANVNNVDGTTTLLKLKVEYTDSANDFALLSISEDSKNLLSLIINNVRISYIQKSLWKNTDGLKEGEITLYMGYPMLKGIEKQNHPISRVGYISQIIPNKDNFLIDGFVQHGHSGSPVFLIKEIGNNIPPNWGFYLIGITTAFPSEYSDIFEDVRYKKDTSRKALINPGFTFVTSMNKIIPILENYFK